MKALGILLLAIACFVIAQGTSIALFFNLFYVLLILLLVAYLWAWVNLQGLEVEREVGTRRAQVGEEARERLVVTNTWSLPKLWVEVRDHSDMPYHGAGFVAYLPGEARRRWVVRTPCTLRGKWTLGPVTVHSGDPFGIFKLRAAGRSDQRHHRLPRNRAAARLSPAARRTPGRRRCPHPHVSGHAQRLDRPAVCDRRQLQPHPLALDRPHRRADGQGV